MPIPFENEQDRCIFLPSPHKKTLQKGGKWGFYTKSWEKPRCSSLGGDLPVHVRSPWLWTGQEYDLSLILSFAEEEIQIFLERSGGSGRTDRY